MYEKDKIKFNHLKFRKFIYIMPVACDRGCFFLILYNKWGTQLPVAFNAAQMPNFLFRQS
uniref:Uncharacterized protein n=1 Tax=Meloidogyne enterolobii TaxID=390850 RepID=A0A6V7UMQ4_MELEN|nr:unnamed protein product [Meloidogyne enterolobii]